MLEIAYQSLNPGAEVVILGMTTQGDQISMAPGPDRRQAVHQGAGSGHGGGRADLAVHSMKDVPMVMPEGVRPGGHLGPERIPATPSSPTGTLASTTCLPGPWLAPPACAARPSCGPLYPQLEIRSLRGNLDTV